MAQTIPEPVYLDEEDIKKLRQLAADSEAFQTFVEMVADQGKSRLVRLNEQGRAIWAHIATKYKIDNDLVNWSLDPGADRIVPVVVKVKRDGA